VFDVLCGWSYAAWPVFEEIWQSYRNHLEFEVVSGGLFVDDRIQPIGAITYIPEANRYIAELSGTTFGDGYEELRLAGSFLLDSSQPAWRFAVLRSLAPTLAVPMARELQLRHYNDGADPGTPDVYRKVGQQFGIAPKQLDDAFAFANPRELAESEFRRSRELGVHSFPTFLLSAHGVTTQVGEGLPDRSHLTKIIDSTMKAEAT
jgi:putative protein-disulfide isomerase